MRINPNESALKYQKCIIKSHLGYFHHSNFKFSKKCYLHWWNMAVSWIMYMCFVYFILFIFLLISVISTTILRNQDFFFHHRERENGISWPSVRELPSHNHSAIKKHQGFIAVVYNKTLSSSCWTAEYFIYITYLFFYSVIFKLKLNDND